LNNPIGWLLGGQDGVLLDVVQRGGDLGLDAFLEARAVTIGCAQGDELARGAVVDRERTSADLQHRDR
jgi:hypothetical protein